MTAVPSNIANLPSVATTQAPARVPARSAGAIIPQSMDDALRYAKVIAASGMLPKSFYEVGDPVAAAFAAIQLGAEVGLSPMASVQNIAVVNGKPALYGPAQLAVCEASGMLEDFAEWIEGDGETLTAYCRVKRYGRPEKVVAFSWADAKKANLTGKRGPWQEYPKRMMQARARTFALRDTLPDVLLGLAYSVEELQDVARDPVRRSDTIEHAPDGDPMPAAAEPIRERAEEVAARPKPWPKPIKVKVPGQPDVEFSQDGGLGQALRDALAFMSGAILDGGAGVVEANAKLLDRIAEKLPDMAEAVADLRAAAAMAGEVVDDAYEQPADDDFPGDMPSRGTGSSPSP